MFIIAQKCAAHQRQLSATHSQLAALVADPCITFEIKAVSEADRLWFELFHPGREYRLRPISAVERVTLLAPDGTHVLVQQVAPDVRIGVPTVVCGHLPNDDAVLWRGAEKEVVCVAPGGRA
jgi:hypothetical protein